MSKKNPELGLRFVSLLLGVGGIAGVATTLWLEIEALRANGRTAAAALTGVFVGIFSLCVWVGVELWQKKARAFKWAQVLLVMQIPVMTFPGFSYEFYTALMLLLVWKQPTTTIGFEFEVASKISFYIFGNSDGFIFGLNLIPIIALYVLGKARKQLLQSAKISESPLI